MRARWLRDQKRIAEVEPLVEGLAAKLLTRLNKENAGLEAQLARAVGDLYQRIELYSAAERWYRRLLKLSPGIYEPLAMSLAKQGRIQEAVALCQEAATGARVPGSTEYPGDESLRPALMLAAVLTSGKATLPDLDSAEPLLKKALESHKEQPDLLNCIAGIRVLRDQPNEAIGLYRKLLKQQPKNVGVLNDLATVLSEQPESENRREAMECIERAIELAGPQAGLLDTKGMILYFDGKLDRALVELQAAVQTPNSDPRFCFHLAVVYGRLGQLDKSRAALQQARDADLEHQLLTKKDRQLLAELEKQLAQ
jgi:tetratricopeptide (TPR) repeat protein